MARPKSTRTLRKRAPVNTASVLSTSALNTRIHRILNAGTELKRYSSDSSYNFPAANTNMLAYVNPFAGIVQGTSLNQRIGDSILVSKIVVTIRYYPSFAGANYASDLSCDFRNSMIKVPDTSLAGTTLGTISLSNFCYSGFVSTGMLNDHDNKVVADKKKTYVPTPLSTGFGAMAGGTGYKNTHLMHAKSFGSRGHKVTFKTGTNLQNQDNFIMVLAADLPGYLTGASQGVFFYAYNVFYRDA